mmetsp:Transcript_1210/g.4825  ORF Transcript_1210/g.4825 Transcript_1210/m.4825 type:complete len:279 (+) Transcript_1210:407-1243(+)
MSSSLHARSLRRRSRRCRRARRGDRGVGSARGAPRRRRRWRTPGDRSRTKRATQKDGRSSAFRARSGQVARASSARRCDTRDVEAFFFSRRYRHETREARLGLSSLGLLFLGLFELLPGLVEPPHGFHLAPAPPDERAAERRGQHAGHDVQQRRLRGFERVHHGDGREEPREVPEHHRVEVLGRGREALRERPRQTRVVHAERERDVDARDDDVPEAEHGERRDVRAERDSRAREQQLDGRVEGFRHGDHDRREEHPEDVVEEEPREQDRADLDGVQS